MSNMKNVGAVVGGLGAPVHLRLAWQLYVAERLERGPLAPRKRPLPQAVVGVSGRVAPHGMLDFATFRDHMAVADWIRAFSWDAFVTPTFAMAGVSERRA